MGEKAKVDLIPCGCGCGKFRPRLDKRGRPRLFIFGHSPVGRFFVGFKHKEESKRKIGLAGRGAKHWQWKGGRVKHCNGYILLKARGHPRATKRGHYVFEHILVMEKHLGRYLTDGEVVHHINGDKTDNRISNLELTDMSAHTLLHSLRRQRDEKGRWY